MSATYLMSGRSSEPYQTGHWDEEQEQSKEPLRATYSISNDEKIYLFSPYIPADVSWTINGTKIEGDFIETKSLGMGEHELRFQSATIKGKLKIKIVE
ncbi:MAG: hypothetical protein IJ352_00820 [Muribaculaceae bacterium]|nr:hypothetical protein [Muribaculaceae bacterium]